MMPDPDPLTLPAIEWTGTVEYDDGMEVWATTFDRSARDRAIFEQGYAASRSSFRWCLLASFVTGLLLGAAVARL